MFESILYLVCWFSSCLVISGRDPDIERAAGKLRFCWHSDAENKGRYSEWWDNTFSTFYIFQIKNMIGDPQWFRIRTGPLNSL